MNKRRNKTNKYKKQQKLRRHIFISVFILCSTIILTLGIFSITTDAKDASEDILIKYYTSIEVTNGDSLWTIASEYMDEHYESISNYIEEVKHINALNNETIYTGQHLVIPYYSDEILN